MRIGDPRGLKRGFSSARQWYVRQTSDHWVQAARREQFRSRAAFKLLQIQEKYQILSRSRVVLDLGAAPGGWSQVAAKTVPQPNGRVISIDILDMPPIDGVEFVQGDFSSEAGQEMLLQRLGTSRPDLILSDMAPNLTGIRDQDDARSVALIKAAFRFSLAWLQEGGHFVAKVFDGRSTRDLDEALRMHYSRVAWVKPMASRRESSELFVVAMDRRPFPVK